MELAKAAGVARATAANNIPQPSLEGKRILMNPRVVFLHCMDCRHKKPAIKFPHASAFKIPPKHQGISRQSSVKPMELLSGLFKGSSYVTGRRDECKKKTGKNCTIYRI